MNKNILNTDIQLFIAKNIDTDIVSLLLKKPIFNTVSQKELAEQIESKKRCRNKLPTWFKTAQIYYPKKLNIEQSSSEIAARYKSEIVSGKTLVDLTGGLGVDCYYFAQKMKSVIYCEINAELAEIAAHNFNILGVENIQAFLRDGVSFLKEEKRKFDWLYLDPSRRSDKKGKVFHLSDCSPDVTQHYDLLFRSTKNLLIKTAPFLDISSALKNMKYARTLHIVAIDNEVKELLWVMRKNYTGQVLVKTRNYYKGRSQTFDFYFDEEQESNSDLGAPMKYLYEANAAIMKSGAFKTISSRYALKKLHQHTHLYTSDDLLDFPGRIFVIRECLPYNSKAKSILTGKKANISTRNFPKSVTAIKKKYKITDGGKIYLFFTKNMDNKLVVLHCEKLDRLVSF